MTSAVLNTVRAFDVKKLGFDPWPVVAGWVVSAAVAVAVPWAHWNKKKQMYYKYAGYMVEYQNQQRQGENGQQQYYGNNCSWWQWGCSNNQYGNNNYQNQQQQQQQYQNANYNQQYNQNGMRFPSWFMRLGGTTEEDRRQREEQMGDAGAPSAVRLIHAWTNILFIGLVIFGAVSLARGTNLNSVRTAFFIFLQAAIMMMILIPQGAISTEDREMENSVYGWYGQLGVLMVYQDFWYALYSVFACIFLTVRMIFVQRQARAVTASSANYKTMDENQTTDIA